VRKRTLFVIVLIFFLHVHFAYAEEKGAIAASASSQVLLAPDSARITVLYEASGDSAQAATASATKLSANLFKKLQSAGINAALSTRGTEFSSVPAKGQILSPKVPLRVKLYLAVTVSELEKLAKIIDLCLETGATEVRDVELFVSKRSEGEARAFAEAATKAKARAKDIAKALGVQLGALQGVQSTRVPSGQTALRRLQQGENMVSYRDEVFELVVEARYSVAGG